MKKEEMAGSSASIDQNSEPLFRQIAPADYELLSRFLVDNDVPGVVRTFNPFPMTAETARSIALLPHKDRYYGAFMEGRLVGLAMLRGWDEEYEIPSFGIMIDHRFHDRGLGGKLLDYTVAQAWEIGAPRVRLSVYGSNARGVHLYRARGFVEVSREPVVLAGELDEKLIMFKDPE